jgi:hypothetical protein
MSSHSEVCRTNARHCLEIAHTTSTVEDTCEFLSLAGSWQRLATEIEHNERFIALIDKLAARNPTKADTEQELEEADTEQELEEFSDHSPVQSFQRLAAAIVSISSHFVADRFALVVNESDQLEERQQAAR